MPRTSKPNLTEEQTETLRSLLRKGDIRKGRSFSMWTFATEGHMPADGVLESLAILGYLTSCPGERYRLTEQARKWWASEA